ncbi:hypothetical protein BS333_13795 [Vibrio azureus]|uniref:GH18 domain-containing protein n=1 Tax=Vibrio azureus NBRC 104587 TaxID=1219077 RepID=U3C7B1_9VIBR|nr:hypothetical protein [Vibrio azureus]AUI87491.1 hypothetical protein BS333_13795 [Vibrio azureus]GAD77269.1 hypothetical protein VAZ01S_069_00170 [Vibrio azureus NBRC 104587]
MKNIIGIISLLIITGGSHASEFSGSKPTAAYMGAYALNQDPYVLEKVDDNYDIKDVSIGFLLIKKGLDCNFDNITDGSYVNPITGHAQKYKNFEENGGKVGLVFGGAAGGQDDPVMVCDAKELYNLIDESIRRSPVNIDRITFDIEHETWRNGDFSPDETEGAFYQKLGNVLHNLNNLYPDISLELSIPQYSSYWARPYNNQLRNFLSNFSYAIDEYHIMTQASSTYMLRRYVNDTMSKLEDWPKDKTVILLVGSNNNQFKAENLKTEYSQYMGMATLLTQAAVLDPIRANLHKEFNSQYPNPNDFKIYTLPMGGIEAVIPQGIYYGEHRVIAKINDVYNFETYKGTCYYCDSVQNDGNNMLAIGERERHIAPGSIITLSLHSGGPGSSMGKDTLIRELSRYIVKGVPDYGYPHYQSDLVNTKRQQFSNGDIVYNDANQRLFQCFDEAKCNINPEKYEPGEGINWQEAWKEYVK